MWEDRLAIYDELITTNKNFERKGKTMLYTSAYGYMFSQLNKNGEIGIRLSKDEGLKFMKTHGDTEFKSYGAVMKGYVKIPENLLVNTELLSGYLNLGYEYVMSLETKTNKK